MFPLNRTTLPALCLSLILPCTLHAADGETPEPAKEAQPAPVQRQALNERSQDDALALERQAPKEEQQTLQAGSESFLALWKPANSGDPEGALIILAGAGETADWPKAVGPLRRKFPDAGWHSLSLSLPDLLAPSPQSPAQKASRHRPKTHLPTPMPALNKPRPPKAKVPITANRHKRRKLKATPMPNGFLLAWMRPSLTRSNRMPVALYCSDMARGPTGLLAT